MDKKIRVAIMDDHQSIVDGYLYRLGKAAEIEVVGAVACGADLDPLLEARGVDVLLMDVKVPVSDENPNPFPILYAIPNLLQRYPAMNILVISVMNQAPLVEALTEAGVSGYVLKDDHESIRELAHIVITVARGGIYYSPAAHRHLVQSRARTDEPALTDRQLEALSLCAAYPDSSTAELAEMLGVAQSTLRNLLSGAYVRLGVHTRAAAIALAQRRGLIPSPGGTGNLPII